MSISMSSTTQTDSEHGQGSMSGANPPVTTSAARSPRMARNAKYGSNQSLNTVNGGIVETFPKKPSQEAKDRVLAKIQLYELRKELTKKTAECDILREGGRQIREELTSQKAETDEIIRRLEGEKGELSAQVEELRAREDELEMRAEDLQRDLSDASAELKEVGEEKKHWKRQKSTLRGREMSCNCH
ncbi:hypothetical protein Bbelb_434500 [Branchiostoma belcheri]|nr:hypothetical protein Bbelb_434500 [Branchiostoma belcheri]